MRRREVLAGLATAAWPPAAEAQQPAIPRIGLLSSRSRAESEQVIAAFRRGLGEAGFSEGRDVAIEYRWADGRYDQLPILAADLVATRVAIVFAAGGPPAALAAKAATSTIPIVFSSTSDPIALGLVASLNRPGGNVTGMAPFMTLLGAKCLELLKELKPASAVIAYLSNPSNPAAELGSKEALGAATALGIRLHILNASTEQELDEAFAALAKLRVDGLVVPGEPFFDSQRNRIVALAGQYSVPTTYVWREYVAAGGLISYGPSLTDSYRQAGVYAGRILKGAKPGDLPVVQPTKFELVVNLRTAKALGLEVPARLQERADEVIE